MAERRQMRTKDGQVWDLNRAGGAVLEAILRSDRGGVLIEVAPEVQEAPESAPGATQEPVEAPESTETPEDVEPAPARLVADK